MTEDDEDEDEEDEEGSKLENSPLNTPPPGVRPILLTYEQGWLVLASDWSRLIS